MYKNTKDNRCSYSEKDGAHTGKRNRLLHSNFLITLFAYILKEKTKTTVTPKFLVRLLKELLLPQELNKVEQERPVLRHSKLNHCGINIP